MFWHILSVTDYLEELKLKEARIAKSLSSSPAVRLDPANRTQMRCRTKAQGMGASILVRMG